MILWQFMLKLKDLLHAWDMVGYTHCNCKDIERLLLKTHLISLGAFLTPQASIQVVQTERRKII